MDFNEVTIDGIKVKFRPVYSMGYHAGYFAYAKDREERYYTKGRYPECFGAKGFDKNRFMRTAAQDYIDTLRLSYID